MLGAHEWFSRENSAQTPVARCRMATSRKEACGCHSSLSTCDRKCLGMRGCRSGWLHAMHPLSPQLFGA